MQPGERIGVRGRERGILYLIAEERRYYATTVPKRNGNISWWVLLVP